ncbi:membrane-associated lipoprotein involved in thiamine biosynthesis [Aequorivita sublithincola DSM 14238]|uniref:FAD:protein FMN transferase n=1 Tax=Aequorivita sublithincola (strain DSM 14238 / LMG 21431 / ACAM 643 / 9-3) TaxID=746697 RepID=I3YSN9_AEQSU|nr:FAD:protein FMN transferase [Aequorivita sublithincola]AFL80007.1 membrane-associated lipoprotein involved in thiamine biosynthesis [Aequorivita sublithincola DSM 14238]
MTEFLKCLAFSFLFLLFSCGNNKPEPIYLQGEAFGTTYNIQFYSEKNIDFKKGLDSVIDVVNHSVSTYIPESDISKVNRGDSTIVVDSIFREVFKISEEVNKKTNGYFDPTIGILRNAYGFGDVKPLKEIDEKTLDSLMQFVGFHKVKINSDGTISKEYPQIYFDFNAVAKGFGIDCLGRYLESKGVTNYLIELGGEILTKGENLVKNQDWVVGVETVDSELEDRSFEATVKLKNVGMASSGNYRKFRIDSASGKKYVHTLNPLTGSAEMSDVTSSTVIAPTCGVADAYATSFMALGLEKSKELLKNLPDVEAYLTFNDSLNNHQVFVTDGFKKRLGN